MSKNLIPLVLAAASIGLFASQNGCERFRSAVTPPGALPEQIELATVDSPVGENDLIKTWEAPQSSDEHEDGYRLPGMQCLVNRHGIRRKVIPTQPNVRCITDPANGTPTGPRLGFFRPYFVFGVYPREKEIAAYQIGPTPQPRSIIGWVPASCVAAWDTRVGARYCRGSGTRTPPLLVYDSRDALEELVVNKTTTHKPIARASYKASGTWMPWPIAETNYFTANGRTYEFARLNFLGQYGAAPEFVVANLPGDEQAYSSGEVAAMKGGVRMLDVCFVLDSTHSTGPFIDAIRETVEMIATRLRELPFKPDVACSLVLFRDYVPRIMFDEEDGEPAAFKHFPLTGDFEGFVEKIRTLREAADGSEDLPEAVYDGVAAGLGRTKWRGNGLSARVVVLVGDNSGHERGNPKNPYGIDRQRIIKFARERDVKIFSVCITGAGDKAEQQLHWEQFRDVAKGTGGQCYRLSEAEKIVDRVRAILETETAIVHRRSVVLDALTEGKGKDEIAGEMQIDVGQVTEVMEFLRHAGVVIERLRPGVPMFATGWCLVEVDGTRLLEKEVYVARAELDLLLSELNALCVHLSPDAPGRVFRAGLGIRVDPLSFFAERRPEPMDIFLAARGIPCSHGVLKLTRSEVEHMPEDDRAVLRERIAREIVPQLTNARNNDQYFTWQDDLEFGWVPECYFP